MENLFNQNRSNNYIDQNLIIICQIKKYFSVKFMKKLLDIIKLDQLDECYQLELDFKTERHNLKRYLKSMRELKNRIKVSHQYFANLVQQSGKIIDDQGSIKKKNSQLDYFMINGVKPFKVFNLEGKKLESFYQTLANQIKDTIERLIKYLDQSKESYNRVSKEHQKVVRQYAERCFPQTATILYLIGFVNSDKIKKVDDMMKQQCILKQTQMFIKILNTYLDQMEGLKNETTSLFKQFYLGATQLWITCCEDMQKQMTTYDLNEEQILNFYKETGGAITDRSDRSNKSNHNQQQI